MKKVNRIATLFALLPLCALAQPQVTSTNVDFNFSGEFYWTNADGFTPGPAGANQTWDFSSLDLTLLGTDTSIPVSGSPFAATFPTANYAYRYDGMGGTRYYYHNITAAKYEILSMGYNTDLGWNYTPDPMVWAQFPYTFGTVFTDTFQSTDDEIATSATYTYDAYGTLVLPTGTYTDVIRQKVVKNGQTNYNWFNVQPFFPLLQTVLEENSLGVVKNTTLGTGDPSRPTFALWPNPTAGAINLTSDTNFDRAKIAIYDALGKKVVENEVVLQSGDAFALHLDNQTSGLYFLTLSDADGKQVLARKIIRE
ncbi:T9SS type A sorting domain-containing protein [Flavobacterium selenitireducens]|uniref:T9SS type A sorting domain-containing protein n=1 Tax=Flavobacterium selenitireducens TaxID=2722704 RepID=UPI00168AD042|nr:T9SS type A sorting domain-containing protein [Flavobacterium selenitireducens]MBD3581088.1 T9SS type A sorting domain-containing protein [Flavobacterium selenitireducens]